VTSDRVVESAARIANESGLGSLTLAAVAADLGIRTPSLYKHVDGLPALRRLLAIRARYELAAVLSAATVGRSRREALHSLATAYRGWAAGKPASAAAAQQAATPGDEEDVAAATAATEVVFAALGGYGLSDDRLIDATRALRAGLVGWAVLEAAEGFGLARPVDASFHWWLDAFDTALSAGSVAG